jgi:hypothetical protein
MNRLFKFISFNVTCAMFAFPMFVASATEVPVPMPGSGNTVGPTSVNLTTINGGTDSVTWTLSQSGNTFTYVYNLSMTNVLAAINTVVLSTGSAVTSSELSANLGFAGPETITTATDPFLKDLPASTFGILFSGGVTKITITTNQAPIWGNIFFSGQIRQTCGKNGCPPVQYASAYNNGFTTQPPILGGADWLPVPGSLTAPEPSTYLLLGSALVIPFFLRRFKTTKESTIKP